ncbi:hypothetical protein AB0A91_17030 [Streptomyces sp. NPDC042207]|uniref:hypothetical protein n=1 Tax=Streptomyces sp. NPDC042207 TaxID=3154331 RepID=UPI0033E67A84
MPDVRRIAGRYELLEQFSHGGMGDVWRGYDAVLDRPVAVKLIRPQAVTSPHRSRRRCATSEAAAVS